MQTWTLTATSMSAGRHGGQAIGLSCYWRRLFSWATNKELPFSPRIALSAPCLMKWRTRMRITWSVTQCELAEFVRERECVSTCIGVAFMHNHASVMMLNRKLKISRRARAIFAPQNCWLTPTLSCALWVCACLTCVSVRGRGCVSLSILYQHKGEERWFALQTPVEDM